MVYRSNNLETLKNESSIGKSMARGTAGILAEDSAVACSFDSNGPVQFGTCKVSITYPAGGQDTSYYNVKAYSCLPIKGCSPSNASGENTQVYTAVSDKNRRKRPVQPLNRSGTLNIISSNIQGLDTLELIPGVPDRDADDSFQIGRILGAMEWNILAVQENFNFNDSLRDGLVKDRNRSHYQDESRFDHGDIAILDNFIERGSGLDMFTMSSITMRPYFQGIERLANDSMPVATVRWKKCSNIEKEDCLAKKGFRVTEMQEDEGMTFHFYNIHMDAGGSDRDKEVRISQRDQLLSFINLYSRGMPIIIVGDFNISIKDDNKNGGNFFRPFRREGFVSAAKDHMDNDPLWNGKDRIDQIWHKSSRTVTLSNAGADLNSWVYVTDEELLPTDTAEESSSKKWKYTDHPAVQLKLNWSTPDLDVPVCHFWNNYRDMPTETPLVPTQGEAQ